MVRPLLLASLLALLLAAPPAHAANEWVACTPVNVATFSSRVHVRCASSVGTGIFFFARETSNAADAQRFLSTLLAAHVSGRPLSLLADLSNTSNLPSGCAASDCRLLVAAAVGE
jgi:hypothetical protein